MKYYYKQTDTGWYYFGLGGLHRKININANGNFVRFNNSYFQNLDFKLTQSMTGFYLMTGLLIPIKSDRFFLDLGLGIGRATLKVEHFNVPEDALLIYSPPLFRSDSRSEGTVDYYMLFFGHVSINYKF